MVLPRKSYLVPRFLRNKKTGQIGQIMAMSPHTDLFKVACRIQYLTGEEVNVDLFDYRHGFENITGEEEKRLLILFGPK